MTTSEFDVAQCLQKVRQHNQDAARALVEALYPLVIRIVRRHLPARSTEEDLAQEVFLKMFSRLDQYQPRAGIPFEHWVSRVAIRTCLDAARAETRRPELRLSDLSEDQNAWLEFMTADPSPPPDSSPTSARELLETLLAQLSPTDRLVIQLLDLEEKSVGEIARITGWGRSLIKVRAFRARRKLRKLAENLQSTHRYEGL
jgi:RNA polymerase sigma factor (sigma-70 family)